MGLRLLIANGDAQQMSNLSDIIKETKNGHMTRKEKLLLGVIAIMDETLSSYLGPHAKWCETHKNPPKIKPYNCNCGRDAAYATYDEIEMYLAERGNVNGK